MNIRSMAMCVELGRGRGGETLYQVALWGINGGFDDWIESIQVCWLMN